MMSPSICSFAYLPVKNFEYTYMYVPDMNYKKIYL